MGKAKIGVIDSGVGGLCLVQQMQKQDLEVDCYYICDHKNVPYGQKSQQFMLKQSGLMVKSLLAFDIHDILIACNTLTVETIAILRAQFPQVRFVGIEPFVNYLNHPSSLGTEKLGLILTQATFNSQRFKDLQSSLDIKNEVDVCPLDNLAQLIEDHYYNESGAWSKIEQELSFIHQKNWTHIILGCTHYPLIKEYFEKEFKLTVIDPHSQVIARLSKTAQLYCGNGFEYIQFSSNLGECWEKVCPSNVKLSISASQS